MKNNLASQSESSNAIPVFWTGGMDSTFRVLDLVLHYGCEVQPIYVQDSERNSTSYELATIHRIYDRVVDKFPEKAHLLHGPLVVNRQAIPLDPEITRKFNALRAIEEVSWQYEWLANVPEATGYSQIELGVKGITPLFRMFRDHVVEEAYSCGAKTWRLVDWDYANEYEESSSFFGAFSLPILFLDKKDLEETAKEHGFADLLQMIWFCHYPWGNQPCGACSVCRSFLKSNSLIEFSSGVQFRNRIWFVVHPLRLLLREPRTFAQRVIDNLMWFRSDKEKT